MEITAGCRVLAVAFLTALGGCGGNSSDESTGTPRSYTRTETPVTVTTSGTSFTASKTVTVSNDDAGATKGQVQLENPVGSISATSASNGYQIQAVLTATANSDAEARAALATMSLQHSDAFGNSTLQLQSAVQYATYNGNGGRTAAVTASLPSALDYQLEEDGAATVLSSVGLGGSLVEMNSSTGTVTVSGTWDTADLSDSAAAISASGNIATLNASNSGSGITAVLSCTRNTQAALQSGAGNIDVTVSQNSSAGYDVTADSTGGSVAVVVAGTSPNGSQSATHAHYTSANFSSSNPKITVAGQSTAGNVSVHN